MHLVKRKKIANETHETVRITGLLGYINTSEIKIHSVYKDIHNFDSYLTLKNFYYLTIFFADDIIKE